MGGLHGRPTEPKELLRTTLSDLEAKGILNEQGKALKAKLDAEVPPEQVTSVEATPSKEELIAQVKAHPRVLHDVVALWGQDWTDYI